MEEFEVRTTTRDAHGSVTAERTLRFVGECIARKSSPRRSAYGRGGLKGDRWTETTIFKTRGGQYVVSGVGRSTIQGETDRTWAHVCEGPVGVVAALYLYDETGVRYLTRVNEEALLEASRNDAAIHDAYMIETVD